MIDRYSDHSANERTFLAWLRTGIATIGFGLAIEKLNLFMGALEARAGTALAIAGLTQRSVSGFLGHYDGAGLIFVGVALIGLATGRYIRIGRLIDAEERYSVRGALGEFIIAIALTTAAIVAYVTLQ
ncbi:YidH family protein [Bradyrhizobium sp. NBAIM08]|uniref:YidH family protein n=1 Tax=Bradyrhizobium sp. NBAIM08 TaxID=2793815 RepID=UPI001CD1EFEC|nr:DUF202 domain-containing protein [Bradyrhizobium sp. NBAIM08]MCA1474178.1 DUF202 domain-containing protein [Bradyrhizobium sp. NBAIM08]